MSADVEELAVAMHELTGEPWEPTPVSVKRFYRRLARHVLLKYTLTRR